jgi:CRP-like cAMP-binding protein
MMEKASLAHFINQLIPISIEVLDEITSKFEERTIPKHHFFLSEGEFSKEYLFLESGFMRAFTLDVDGNEVTTNFYAGNNVVFEVSSFFTQTRSKENIQALTDCKGYVISFEQLNMLFHSLPQFREFGRGLLVKGFVALKERTFSLINQTAEQRYAHLIQSKPEIFQHAALKHIATYLGITDTSLSRIRKDLARK